MNVKDIKLKDNGVIIADVHYKRGDESFLRLLKKWINNPPTQVIFLGDIFQLLLPFDYLIEYNAEAILLINALSEKTQVYYTYGNHDFNLESIFPRVIFADAFADERNSILLSHGDLTDPKDKKYQLYAKIIRIPLVCKILHYATGNFKNNKIFNRVLSKPVKCAKIPNFEDIALRKLEHLEYDLIIEGHYHQDRDIVRGNQCYINMPAYVCNKKYILLKLDNKKRLLLKEEYGR
jgi:UDP-2,3-diacylglucosamine hydrolase